MPGQGKAEPCCFSDREHAPRCQFQVVRSPIRNVMRNIQSNSPSSVPEGRHQPAKMRPPPRAASNENRPPPQQPNNVGPVHGQVSAADYSQDAAKKVPHRRLQFSPRGPSPQSAPNEQRPTLQQPSNVGQPPMHGQAQTADPSQDVALIARLRSRASAEASRAAELQSEVFECAQTVKNAQQRAAIAERKVQYLEMNLNTLEASVESNRQDAVCKTIEASEQAHDLQDAQALLQFQTREIETLVSGHEHMQQQVELHKSEADSQRRTLEAIKESVALCDLGTSTVELNFGAHGQEDTTQQIRRNAEDVRQLELQMEAERHHHAVEVEELMQQNASQLRASQQVSDQLAEELQQQAADAEDFHQLKLRMEAERHHHAAQVEELVQQNAFQLRASQQVTDELAEELRQQAAGAEDFHQLELRMEAERHHHAAQVEELLQQNAFQLRASQQVSDELAEQLRHDVREDRAAVEEEVKQKVEAAEQEMQQLQDARMEDLSCQEAALKAKLLRLEAAEDACLERSEILQEKEALWKQGQAEELQHLESRLAEQAEQHGVHVAELQQQTAAQMAEQAEQLKQQEVAAREELQEYLHLRTQLQAQSDELRGLRASCLAEDEHVQQALSNEVAKWEACLEQQKEVHAEQLLQISDAKAVSEEELKSQMLAKEQELQEMYDSHSDALRCKDETLQAKLLRLEAAEDACLERSEILQEQEVMFKEYKQEAAALQQQSQELQAKEEEAVHQAKELSIALNSECKMVEELRLSELAMTETMSNLQEEKQMVLHHESSSAASLLEELGAQTQSATQNARQVQTLEAEVESLRAEKEMLRAELDSVQSDAEQAEHCQENLQKERNATVAQLEERVDELVVRVSTMDLEHAASLAEQELTINESWQKRQQELEESSRMSQENLKREHDSTVSQLEERLNQLVTHLADTESSHASQLSEQADAINKSWQGRLADAEQCQESLKTESVCTVTQLEERVGELEAVISNMKAETNTKLANQEATINECWQQRHAQLEESSLKSTQDLKQERDAAVAQLEERVRELVTSISEMESRHVSQLADQAGAIEESWQTRFAEAELCQEGLQKERDASAAHLEERVAELLTCVSKMEVDHIAKLADQEAAITETWQKRQAELEEASRLGQDNLKKERDDAVAESEQRVHELVAQLGGLEADHACQLSQQADAINKSWQGRLAEAEHCQDTFKKERDASITQLEEHVQELGARMSNMEEEHAAKLANMEEEHAAKLASMEEEHAAKLFDQQTAINESWQQRQGELEESQRLGQEQLQKEHGSTIVQFEQRVNELIIRIGDMESSHASQISEQAGTIEELWKARLAEVEKGHEEFKKERDSSMAQLEERIKELVARTSSMELEHADRETTINETWQQRLDELVESSWKAKEDLQKECDSAVAQYKEQVDQLTLSASDMEAKHASQLTHQAASLNESWQRRVDEAELSREELQKERDSMVSQLEEQVSDLTARIGQVESHHASQMATWQQQQDVAHAGEIEDFRSQCKELMDTVNQFMQQQESLLMENKSLKDNLALFEDDLERVSDRHAQLIGHVNPKQKIRYTLKLKDEKNELRTELNKTRARLAQLECARRSENLFEALASLGYGSAHAPVGGSPQPVSARRQQGLSPTRVSSASRTPEHSISSRTPSRKIRTLRGGASVGGESDAGDDRMYMMQRQCYMQERTLERLTTDFQHIVSLIERAVVADEANAGSACPGTNRNFALLLQRLRSLSANSQQTVAHDGKGHVSANQSNDATSGEPNTPLTTKAPWSPRGEPVEQDQVWQDPEEDHPQEES